MNENGEMKVSPRFFHDNEKYTKCTNTVDSIKISYAYLKNHKFTYRCFLYIIKSEQRNPAG